jgi:serine protease inhibitor
MLVFLPRKRFDLKTVEKLLTAAKIRQLRNELKNEDVQLTLPKFRFEKSFELGDALKKLGVNDAFGANADFTPMVGKEKASSKFLAITLIRASFDRQTVLRKRPGPNFSSCANLQLFQNDGI